MLQLRCNWRLLELTKGSRSSLFCQSKVDGYLREGGCEKTSAPLVCAERKPDSHEHHVPALIRDGTVASCTGELAREDVLRLLILSAVEGELVGAAGEENVGLGHHG